jgi:hypothetical protein
LHGGAQGLRALRIDYDSVMRDYCNLEILFQITINARRLSPPAVRTSSEGGKPLPPRSPAVAGIADIA